MNNNNSKGLIEQAQLENRKLNTVSACLLVLIFILLGEFIPLITHITIKSVLSLDLQFSSSTAVDTIIRFGVICLSLFLWVLLIEKRSLLTLGLKSQNAFKKFGIGFLYGGLLVLLFCIISFLIGQVQIKSIDHISLSQNLSVFPMLLAFCIQGGTEELLFRGWLLPVIGNITNVKKGVIISSLWFSFIHILLNGLVLLLKYGMSPANLFILTLFFINVFLIGIFFCIISLKQKNIFTAIGLHVSWNWFQQSVFGLSVSGLDFDENSLFSIKLSDSSIWTGKFIGMEAALITTFLLVTLVFLYRKDVFKWLS